MDPALEAVHDSETVRHMVSKVVLAQTTLKKSVHCDGVGLHSGATISLTLRPGAPNSGIIFVRVDEQPGRDRIPARWDRVTDTRLCTLLTNDHGVSVGTVEHLMAALRALNVDNAVIELNGPEVPILDGSAAPWMRLIQEAGLARQAAKRRVIRLHRPVSVSDGDKYALLTPSTGGARFTVEIDFPSKAVGAQKRSLELTGAGFRQSIARARTFGFLQEVEYLRRNGLARGGSLDNAVVIDGDRVVNPDGLRYDDEFVRHKILDSVGDLYLAGAPIIADFHAVKPGHGLNNRLLHALFEQPDAWSLVPADRVAVLPGSWLDETLAATA